MKEKSFARGLGWSSFAIGLAELLFPSLLGRKAGIGEYPRLLRGFGGREIAAGAAVLMPRNPAPGLWARVAGDVVDLGVLLYSYRERRKKGPVAVSLGLIVGVTALDVLAAVRSSRRVPSSAQDGQPYGADAELPLEQIVAPPMEPIDQRLEPLPPP